MRVVLQRVKKASVALEGEEPRSIGPGLLLLIGIKRGDGSEQIPKLAKKCAQMRIFEDENDKMNLSAVQLGYSALVVSNFTLYADASSGTRPSFWKAEEPALAEPLYGRFLAEMEKQGLREVKHGKFGAYMQISLLNDGPVTVVVDTDDWIK